MAIICNNETEQFEILSDKSLEDCLEQMSCNGDDSSNGACNCFNCFAPCHCHCYGDCHQYN